MPHFVKSCVEVAFTAAVPEAGTTTGAVYRPLEVIAPESTDQVTAELKLPVPETLAEHWLFWLVCMLAGTQDTLTAVMVGGTVTNTVDVPNFVES